MGKGGGAIGQILQQLLPAGLQLANTIAQASVQKKQIQAEKELAQTQMMTQAMQNMAGGGDILDGGILG